MDFLGKPCPVCSRNFREDDDVVVCPKCGAPYHRECFQEKGKCIFTDLHKNNKSWEYVPPKEKDESDENVRYCVRCGEKNPVSAIVCKKCGAFMSKEFSDGFTAAPGAGPTGADSTQGAYPPGTPLAVFLDPMGGVSPDEDFDGVTGAELSKYVGNNTSYYLPVFKKLKSGGIGRFNFCACFFTGAWYLFRKQYFKGALIAILYLILEIGAMVTTAFYSSPIVNEASAALEKQGFKDAGIINCLKWTWENKSVGHAFILMLPVLLYLLRIGLSVLCGLFGNKSYYKNALSKIKTIKGSKELSDEKRTAAITKAGGVNTAIAWTCFACYVILSIASQFL